jgi:hypothetical protein
MSVSAVRKFRKIWRKSNARASSSYPGAESGSYGKGFCALAQEELAESKLVEPLLMAVDNPASGYEEGSPHGHRESQEKG